MSETEVQVPATPTTEASPAEPVEEAASTPPPPLPLNQATKKPSEYLDTAFRLTYKVPTVAGVYMIYCDADEKAYIGSTTNLYGRLSGHKIMLKQDKHANKHLQAAFNKYGLATFSFLTLEIMHGGPTPEMLLERENHYLLQTVRSSLFNFAVPAVLGGPPGQKRSPEHREAIRQAWLGNQWRKGSTMSEAHKQRIRECLGGKKHEPERAAKAAAARAQVYIDDPSTLPKGTKNGRAKLDDDKVREIRKLYATGDYSQEALGKRFGVDQTKISEIVRFKKWAHVK